MSTAFLQSNRILLSRLFAVLVLAILFVSGEAWQEAAPMVEHLLSLVGWALVGIGVTGRVWCGSYISGNKNSKLLVDGPYSISRNPLYFFSFVGGFGVMLITETLLLPILSAVLFGLHYREVIACEEKALLELHGAAFEAYRSRVPRFWPNLSLYSEPESYVISAAAFRKHLGDGFWFVMAGGTVALLDGMHISGFLPTILRLY